MAELSGEERKRRQRAVDFVRGSVELSGGAPSPGIDALNRRYVAGEMSSDEHLEAVIAHARSLPHDEPVQEYFTSLDEEREALKVDPGRWPDLRDPGV